MPVVNCDFALCNIEDAVVVAIGAGLKSSSPFYGWQRVNDESLKNAKMEFSIAAVCRQAQEIWFTPPRRKDSDIMRGPRSLPAPEHRTRCKARECSPNRLKEGVDRLFSRPGGQRQTT